MAIDTESLGLYIPTLDPRNEEKLFRQSQLVVFNRSEGKLNDFSDHSPLAALLQGQAFAGAELLYYVNRLPLALVVKFLEITGTERRLGSRATVTLTFTLTAPLSSSFLIPKGFEALNRRGDRVFLTDADLVIPPGLVAGSISATAAAIGDEYNLSAFTIDRFTQPLAFLSGVINSQPSQGGSDAESLEETIERALKLLRRRNLVSAVDFEEAAIEALGAGSRTKAIGLLGSDRVSYRAGAVHVFGLDQYGTPINEAQANQVFQALSPRIQLGTQLFVSPMEVVNVRCRLVGKLLPQEQPDKVADRLWSAFRSFLNLNEPGKSLLIKEVEHELRFAGGLEYIEDFRIDDGIQNIPMPNGFTVPRPYTLICDLVDEANNAFSILRGAGEPESYNPTL